MLARIRPVTSSEGIEYIYQIKRGWWKRWVTKTVTHQGYGGSWIETLYFDTITETVKHINSEYGNAITIQKYTS